MPTTTSFWDHPIEKLEEALSIRKQIAGLQRKLGSMFGGDHASTSSPRPASIPAPFGRRSDEVRARMAAAQQARWAKIRGGSNAVAATGALGSPGSSKKNGGRAMSPEARERIAVAQRARWAKVKGSNASSGAVQSKPPGKRRGGKRTISPEGRARIAEAARQRWAKLKKSG